MKTKLIYGGLFVASMLVSTGLVLFLVPRPAEHSPKGSTSSMKPKEASAKRDSAETKKEGNPGTQLKAVAAAVDTLKSRVPGTVSLKDSVAILRANLEAERKKVAALLARETVDTTRNDTTAATDKKTMAKLLDAMDAQGAAKILRNMDDKEVRAVLLSVKKRQAGKILSSLDPERAARIMR